ncbi:MAG: DUF346 domain-containing protein [Actinomycetota bacterium]|nr:DUF346 domain-containing protein [Actinomycetota bacterium]
MSSNIRKCVCFGPDGFETVGSYQNYVNGSNRSFINDSTTLWTRIWINWRTMNDEKMGRLDAQINQLNVDRRPVILVVMHEFPTWLDGGRSNIYLLPNDLSTNGDWARFIESIYTRYMPKKPNPGPTIHMLEIVNEPNITFQPRDSALPGKVVQMFRTAQAISAKYDHQLYLGGPALADTTAAGADWRVFHDAMKATGFKASPNFVWTHHNYGDVESANDSSRDARNRINTWWTGYDEGDGPISFCTEGGARMVVIGEGDYARQKTLVSDCFDKLFSAARVGMQTNYLMYDAQTRQSNGALTHYSGLRGPAPWGESRPVYNTWKLKNTGYPDLYRWRGPEDLGPWLKWDCSMLSQHPGHVEIFAIGGDGAIYNNWQNGGNWSGWGRIGGNWASGPAAVSIKDGAMHVFAIGHDQQVYGAWWVPNVGWSNFYPLGGGCTYDPGISSWSEHHMELFVRGNDGKLYHKWWFDWAGWSDWHQLWGGQVVGSPSAVSWADGRTDVVWQATDRSLYHMWCVNGGWNGPESLGGWLVGHPEICSWKPGHLDIICGGSGNKLWRKTFDRQWGEWEPITGSDGFQYSPGAVSWGPGRIDIAFQRDNRMHHMWYG